MPEVVKLIPKRKMSWTPEMNTTYAHFKESFGTPVSIREITANDARPVLTLDQDGSGSNLLLTHTTQPELEWYEEDQTKPAGQFRTIVASDTYILQAAASADFATTTDILTAGGSPRILISNVLFQALNMRGSIIYPDTTTAGDTIALRGYVGASTRVGIAVKNVSSGDVQILIGSSSQAADIIGDNNLDICTKGADAYIMRLRAWDTDGGAYRTMITLTSGDTPTLSMGTNIVANVVDPVSNQDAATKNYVDTTVVTDHGGLGGLSDDDHTGYVLADGTRAISELRLTPKASSSGPEGTMFYDSDDDSVYVATEA